jgi:hypothetical protein
MACTNPFGCPNLQDYAFTVASAAAGIPNPTSPWTFNPTVQNSMRLGIAAKRCVDGYANVNNQYDKDAQVGMCIDALSTGYTDTLAGHDIPALPCTDKSICGESWVMASK